MGKRLFKVLVDSFVLVRSRQFSSVLDKVAYSSQQSVLEITVPRFIPYLGSQIYRERTRTDESGRERTRTDENGRERTRTDKNGRRN